MDRHPNIPGIEIGEELGHGAFSVVYRARCRGEACALKLPRSRGRWTRWVYREAVALARLRHPALPTVLEVGEVDGLPYLAMELVEGKALADRLGERRMSEPEVIDLAIRLSDTLHAVHAAGLVHRDVKPRNIVIEAGGGMRLVDFGFATPMERTTAGPADAAGTPGFAAPEQYREPDRLGPWTDVYGVGASMFACLAAFAPQAADARMSEDHLVSAKKIWAGQYSDNILEVIDWCLRLDPLERPQSVFALQKAIRDIPPRKRKLSLLGSIKRLLFSEIGA